MKTKNLLILFVLAILIGCTNEKQHIEDGSEITLSQYFDTTGRDDLLYGGVKMVTINTPKGDFKVWTKRIGNNPKIKVLLLHGGPGGTHEFFQCFDSYFPKEGFEYYYYDQLGSYLSDQPNDTSLWKIDRFVEEVEQVRKALKLDSSNFYLYGKSWGGVLSIEYALKYQKNLKGLIISNMVSSSSAFNKYFNEVLVPQMNPEAVAEIIEIEKNRDFTNPKYMGLVMNEFTTKFMFRKPLNEWPGFAFKYMQHTNNNISNLIWGSSTFSITGTLSNWNRANDLKHINIPTLTIGATFDYMNPEHLKWMAGQVKSGRFLLCPKGSHYAMYEDQEVYFKGMIQFIKDVDQGLFKSE